MFVQGRKRALISPSPNQGRSYQDESSPNKASILLRADCSEYVNSLKAKKQNYSTALGLYTACYDHQLPQKCLKHLNFITLYCADESKLLCVNCLYGSTVHKNHSVTPSNSSLQSIRNDNQTNIKLVDESIKQIKQAEIRVNENKKIIERENNFILQEISKEFQQMRKILDRKQRQLKERAVREFEKAAYENEITRKETSWWKQEMHKMRSSLPRDGKTEQAQIYKHLVLQLMRNQKLQTQKLTFIASKQQMQHEFLNEARQLKEVVKSNVDQGSRSNQIKLF